MALAVSAPGASLKPDSTIPFLCLARPPLHGLPSACPLAAEPCSHRVHTGLAGGFSSVAYAQYKPFHLKAGLCLVMQKGWFSHCLHTFRQSWCLPVTGRHRSLLGDRLVLQLGLWSTVMNNSHWHHDSCSIKHRQNEIFLTLCKHESYLLEAGTIKDVVVVTHCPGEQQVRNDSAHHARPPLKQIAQQHW